MNLGLAFVDHQNLKARVAETELELIARLRAGEVAAIGRAYDLHHRSVRAFARRLVGAEDIAEDLVQEVFVSLSRAIHRFRGESSLCTFLMSIAVNHSRHYLRSSVRRRRALERLTVFGGELGAGEGAGDPEQCAARRQLAERLHRAMDELPFDQRVAFVLCEIEERTSKEVGGIVGAPEATVRTRLFHAKKKLRQLLEQPGGPI